MHCPSQLLINTLLSWMSPNVELRRSGANLDTHSQLTHIHLHNSQGLHPPLLHPALQSCPPQLFCTLPSVSLLPHLSLRLSLTSPLPHPPFTTPHSPHYHPSPSPLTHVLIKVHQFLVQQFHSLHHHRQDNVPVSMADVIHKTGNAVHVQC